MRYFSYLLWFLFLSPVPLFAYQDCSDDVCFYTQDGFGSTSLHIENSNITSITATLKCKLTNAFSDPELPQHFVVKKKDVSEPIWVTPMNPADNWYFNCQHFYNIGEANAKHDKEAIYLLPYASGSTFTVSQGYNTNHTHFAESAHALDFKMPVDTPIHAAREGRVVKVYDSGKKGGLSGKNNKYNNYILIEHPDKTIALYGHLAPKGAKVKRKKKVKAGQVIALSGNTGRTTTPHLHFEVYSPRTGEQTISVPTKFKTVEGIIEELKQGHSYTAV